LLKKAILKIAFAIGQLILLAMERIDIYEGGFMNTVISVLSVGVAVAIVLDIVSKYEAIDELEEACAGNEDAETGELSETA
jgi:hypothetical protein